MELKGMDADQELFTDKSSGAGGGSGEAGGGTGGGRGAGGGGGHEAAGAGDAATGGVVIRVKEKKGPLRAAIPRMPMLAAVLCLLCNMVIPGSGTLLSAFSVLCGARTDLPDRHVCCVFWLNVAAALIQLGTAVLIVGWILSIFWGMDMVLLSKGRSQQYPQQL
ncbi:protein stum homolog [Petromyzon marinus]|uniref:Protein stum homolog n=1 Tax=Petromyzon marinus TaxID=7757 RepID=A0AAJ7TKZ3_PETMA|nr:protein stum homolog [Petromyzon marinus]